MDTLNLARKPLIKPYLLSVSNLRECLDKYQGSVVTVEERQREFIVTHLKASIL